MNHNLATTKRSSKPLDGLDQTRLLFGGPAASRPALQTDDALQLLALLRALAHRYRPATTDTAAFHAAKAVAALFKSSPAGALRGPRDGLEEVMHG